MKFTAKVRIGGETAEITYDNGKLSGSPEAVRRVEFLALSLEGTPVGPVPSVTFTNHLACPLSTRVIIEMAYNGQVKFSGKVPRVPRTPKGAVN
ncbi:hypothetical protein [Paenibacillus naphthalenovorans]|uniref:Uncharacterized protein n=1 Tax=Paenibacillus naphthalenovorans TaxID=162209 RepID=A0A0U2L2R3_9BACL|nr:hypothetical protein [Paenibacillus naphthalenovorans]ALS24050.1 hypothetical protein IJ22_37120 [Paenibacillus naphthalenovorans]SDJ75286.1 hypothetical protein SAMN05421868_14229 [Paenibacillus naphthalenovorans]